MISFGEISVIFYKDTISPTDRRNKVFASDVYSPTFPIVSLKFNEKEHNKIINIINKASEGMDYKNTFYTELSEQTMSERIERAGGSFVEAYKDSPLFMLTYLKEKNIPFKPVLKEKNYGEDTELLKMIDKKLSNKLPETYGGFDETMTFEPEIRKIANEYYSKLYKDIPSFQGKEFHSEPLGFSQVMSYLDALRKYKKDTNGTETDRRKTEEKLKKVVKKKRL